MVRKKKETEAELIMETEEMVVFKANRPMDEGEFDLLSKMVRKESEKSGVKVMLIPYSVDLVETPTADTEEDEGSEKE